MSRISSTVLIQSLGEEGVVVMDEATGNEVVIPRVSLGAAIEALIYFRERPLDRDRGAR